MTMFCPSVLGKGLLGNGVTIPVLALIDPPKKPPSASKSMIAKTNRPALAGADSTGVGLGVGNSVGVPVGVGLINGVGVTGKLDIKHAPPEHPANARKNSRHRAILRRRNCDRMA